MAVSPKPEELISDSEIERVHANANFGDTPMREIVDSALLKIACGYSNGSTAQHILADHGLIISRHGRGSRSLTSRGKKYLYAVYGRGQRP